MHTLALTSNLLYFKVFYLLTKYVYISEVRGERRRGRPPFRWMDGVRKACAEREMGLREARGVRWDRNEWRRMTDRIV